MRAFESSGERLALGAGDALVVVDVQNDFLSGGSLAVPDGEAVIPALKRYIRAFASLKLPIVATRDWHPAGHVSFREQGGAWPVHCVQGSQGAGFAAGLQLPQSALVISKGGERTREAYSAFEGTDLKMRLRSLGVRRLLIGGLATDYCVLQTVKDALEAGFAVHLLADAVRAVDVRPGDGSRAKDEMARLGALPTRFEDVADADAD